MRPRLSFSCSNAKYKTVHIVMKATGKGYSSDRWIFNNQYKRELIEELRRFLSLFSPIKLLGFCAMGNHLHIMLSIARDFSVTRSEVAQNFKNCYGYSIHPNSHNCRKIQSNLNSLSAFMQRFAWHFAYHFNHKKKFKRTGHLWGERYHPTEIGDDVSLLRCWVYIIFNPVKANMVRNYLEYQFSSLTYGDKNIQDECMQNLLDMYRYFKGDDTITLEQLKAKLIEMLEEELEEWSKKNEVEQDVYRRLNRIWDKVSYIDKHYFYS